MGWRSTCHLRLQYLIKVGGEEFDTKEEREVAIDMAFRTIKQKDASWTRSRTDSISASELQIYWNSVLFRQYDDTAKTYAWFDEVLELPSDVLGVMAEKRVTARLWPEFTAAKLTEWKIDSVRHAELLRCVKLKLMALRKDPVPSTGRTWVDTAKTYIIYLLLLGGTALYWFFQSKDRELSDIRRVAAAAEAEVESKEEERCLAAARAAAAEADAKRKVDELKQKDRELSDIQRMAAAARTDAERKEQARLDAEARAVAAVADSKRINQELADIERTAATARAEAERMAKAWQEAEHRAVAALEDASKDQEKQQKYQEQADIARTAADAARVDAESKEKAQQDAEARAEAAVADAKRKDDELKQKDREHKDAEARAAAAQRENAQLLKYQHIRYVSADGDTCGYFHSRPSTKTPDLFVRGIYYSRVFNEGTHLSFRGRSTRRQCQWGARVLCQILSDILDLCLSCFTERCCVIACLHSDWKEQHWKTLLSK